MTGKGWEEQLSCLIAYSMSVRLCKCSTVYGIRYSHSYEYSVVLDYSS